MSDTEQPGRDDDGRDAAPETEHPNNDPDDTSRPATAPRSEPTLEDESTE